MPRPSTNGRSHSQARHGGPARHYADPAHPYGTGHQADPWADEWAEQQADPYAAAYTDPYATDPHAAHPHDRIPAQRRAAAPVPRRAAPRRAAPRRSRWPLVVVSVVLVPLLALASCLALFGAGVTAIDNARKGGTVALGQSFRYASGVELAASVPRPYRAPDRFAVERGNVAYESTVTITNGSTRPMSVTLVTMNATVAGAPANRVFDSDALPTQDIAPGLQLKVPFRFQIATGTTGPLQISVQDSFNEPVFFTGSL